jgi:hypothetical protein
VPIINEENMVVVVVSGTAPNNKLEESSNTKSVSST